ncbi:MAG: transporter substrate-binding domain-containing protein [Clostridiales bacterium]|jgi:polar amino acid transport system substrate-binding protein|nr:transporter substrate-binding domain-containing protein [Clostridiales bacterium]
MKKKISIVICLVLAAVTVFTLTSCLGNGDGDTKTTDGSSTTAAPVVKDLENILANKKLVIGITDFEPMDYQDANGKWIGFDAELAEKVCEKLGVTAEFKLIIWDKNIIELNGKTIDCIWNGFTIDEDRAANVTFSKEYMINRQAIVIHKDNAEKFTDIASLNDASFTAEKGSAGEKAIKANATLKDNKYVGVNGQIDALKEVLSKTSDAAVLDYTMGAYLVNKEGSDFAKLMVLDAEITAKEYYGIGFRKGSDLADKVNGILKELEADGTIKAIAEKYGLADSLVKIK